MSRQVLDEHRRVWARKAVLGRIYGVWFDALLGALPARGRVLELGAGPGFLAPYARGRDPQIRWLASDLIDTPWNDLVADGLRLPVRTGALDAIAGLDLVHHLARPAAFFEEAARALRPRGRIAVVEPWVTPVSYPVYRWLHQEGCRLGLDPWDPFGRGPGELKDAFEGDAAVVFQLVRRTPKERWAALGFEPPRARILNGFAYLLSLGFKDTCLLPPPLLPLLLGLDRGLGWAAPAVGLRALVLWERRD